MKIYFTDKKLQNACNHAAEARKRFGHDCAKKVLQRLSEMAAVETLAELHLLPTARCHPLKQNRKGQFAVDAKHPYRVIFEPHCDPIPQKPDGGIDLDRITAICILEIEDYHG